MAGVNIAKVDLFLRVQKVKADMIATEHQASPGQVECPDVLWTRIYNTVTEMETQLFEQEREEQRARNDADKSATGITGQSG
jgi:hypothetical protein